MCAYLLSFSDILQGSSKNESKDPGPFSQRSCFKLFLPCQLHSALSSVRQVGSLGVSGGSRAEGCDTDGTSAEFHLCDYSYPTGWYKD